MCKNQIDPFIYLNRDYKAVINKMESQNKPITISESTGVIRDNNFNTYKVYKISTFYLGVESRRQRCLREIQLVNDKVVIIIPVDEVRMLTRNKHPKITLETSSLNYLKKKVLGY